MKFIPNGVTRTLSHQLLVAQKHSPRLLFVGGVVGVSATVVMACRATLRVQEILDDHQRTAIVINGIPQDEKERKSDLTMLYLHTAGKFAKIYGPSFVLGVTSIGMLTKSHTILTKRNAGITAAYTALEKGFKDYRRRVIAEQGEDKDREYRYGVETRDIEVVGKDGEKPKVKKVKVVGDGGGSIYSRLFDESNPNWSPQPECNFLFLRSVQHNLNQNLESNGHVFLNDVHDALGMSRTPAGSQVGWIWNQDPNHVGDNKIDFGIFDSASMERLHAFVTGVEGAIWLDFNVDGPMWDLI